MSLRHILSVLFILSVSCASEDNNDIVLNNFGNEENTDLDSMLFNLQKNINKKFDAMEKRLDILGKMNHDLEDMKDKFHKLEKNLLDKFENYINDRSDSLEKHVYRKIDELEKILPDKTDIGIINRNLAACRENHINLNPITQHHVLNNQTSENCKGLDQKLNNIEKIISDKNLENNLSQIINSTMYSNFNTLDKTIVSLQENFSDKMSELTKIAPDVEKHLNWQLDVLNNNISENLKGMIISKLGNIQENILSIKENLLSEFDVINSTYTTSEGINQKIDAMQKSFPELQKSIDKRIDDIESLEEHIMSKVNETSFFNSEFCKSLAVTGYTTYQPLISLNNETFNHVTVEFDRDNLTSFEMSLAIKGKEGMIQLSAEKNIKDAYDSYTVIDVGDHENARTSIRKSKNETGQYQIAIVCDKVKYTPSILSPTKFAAFEIKINKGTLEFKKRGSNSPLLTYTDELLKKIKFIGFTSYLNKSATFLYDCPP